MIILLRKQKKSIAINELKSALHVLKDYVQKIVNSHKLSCRPLPLIPKVLLYINWLSVKVLNSIQFHKLLVCIALVFLIRN